MLPFRRVERESVDHKAKCQSGLESGAQDATLVLELKNASTLLNSLLRSG